MSLPTYGSYACDKELGQIPAHWTAVPLKRCFSIVGGSTPKSDETTYWGGDIVWVSPADLSKLSSRYIADSNRKITKTGMNSCGTTLVPINSIILSTRAPIGSLAISSTELCTNQGCKSLVPRANVDSSFYAYVLMASTEALNVRGKGTTFLELSADELGSYRIPHPPLGEQTAIAAFLDCETSKIDALIAEQERLLELLAEKRQATVSHAVTRGLSPDVPMRDSGVEWLGEVPAHWAVCRIKHVIESIEQGWSPQCENFPVQNDNEWGVLKVGCVNGGVFDAAENKKLPPELNPLPEHSLRKGDLLISRANTRELVGSAAVVPRDFGNLLLCDKLYRLRTISSECRPEFIAQFLSTSVARVSIEIKATGASSSMLNIGQEVVLELTMPLPNLQEQLSILEFILEENSKLDALIAESERAIKILNERRSALIFAAVTGKIDVREHTPALAAAA